MVSRSPVPAEQTETEHTGRPDPVEPKRALIWAERAQAIPPHSETRVSVFSSKGLSLGLALPKSSGGRALLPCPILRRAGVYHFFSVGTFPLVHSCLVRMDSI
jgi:hypothetical protein